MVLTELRGRVRESCRGGQENEEGEDSVGSCSTWDWPELVSGELGLAFFLRAPGLQRRQGYQGSNPPLQRAQGFHILCLADLS